MTPQMVSSLSKAWLTTDVMPCFSIGYPNALRLDHFDVAAQLGVACVGRWWR